MKTKKLPVKQQLSISCQRCCKSVGMYLDPANYIAEEKDIARFYAARGFEVCEHNGLLLLIHSNLPCPNLATNGCTIYEKRPEICRGYSGIDDMGDECLWSGLPQHKKAGKKTKKQNRDHK